MAAERYEPLDGAGWARSLAMAFQHLNDRTAPHRLPSWWTDTELLTRSARAEKHMLKQDTPNARDCILKMRARVLYGCGPLGYELAASLGLPVTITFNAAPRTVAQLKEAAASWNLLATFRPPDEAECRKWAEKCTCEAEISARMAGRGDYWNPALLACTDAPDVGRLAGALGAS